MVDASSGWFRQSRKPKLATPADPELRAGAIGLKPSSRAEQALSFLRGSSHCSFCRGQAVTSQVFRMCHSRRFRRVPVSQPCSIQASSVCTTRFSVSAWREWGGQSFGPIRWQEAWVASGSANAFDVRIDGVLGVAAGIALPCQHELRIPSRMERLEILAARARFLLPRPGGCPLARSLTGEAQWRLPVAL